MLKGTLTMIATWHGIIGTNLHKETGTHLIIVRGNTQTENTTEGSLFLLQGAWFSAKRVF